MNICAPSKSYGRVSSRPLRGRHCRFANIDFRPWPVQQLHPLIWVGGESSRALRRTAFLANGWYPIGSNPRFPMGTPAQLAAGIERLAAYVREAGRNAAELDIVYRTHDYALHSDGLGAAQVITPPPPLVGTCAIALALDIRQYEALGCDILWTCADESA